MPLPFAALAQKPPLARKARRSRLVHGLRLEDDYGWLRARNWQRVIEDPKLCPPEIAQYLREENAFTRAAFRPLQGLQKTLIAEMRGRLQEDESEPAQKDGAWLYYERYRKRQQYAIYCRRPVAGGKEQLLLDTPREARAFAYFAVGAVQPCPQHRRLAWSADTTGSESYVIRLRDLASGKDEDRLRFTSGDVVWGRSGEFLYYVALDKSQRPYRVMRHSRGEPQKQDVEIYRERDSGWFVSIDVTQDEAYAILSVRDHETSEVRSIDLGDPEASPQLVFARQQGIEYDIEHHEGRLILRSNQGERPGTLAPDFRITALPFGQRDPALSEVLVPETPGRIKLSVNVLRNWLIWSSLGEAGPRIHVRNWKSGAETTFAPRAVTGDIAGSIGLEYDSDTLRLSFSSPAEPEVTLDHNLVTGAESVLKRQIVPSGHDAGRYRAERVLAPAHDGQTIPVTLLRLADTAVDGTAPALLYGYGAYGASMDADFEIERLSLVDRGFVYAIAHVRGGMEKGFRWYREGKREKKINTFLDFIAVADFLVEQGYAAPRRIVAQGASAGGMLMGGVANMAGEKFAGIVAEVPFVDSLNTILDPSLPLTPPEWVEWGNPIHDPAVFAAMRAYSPYDNLLAKAYPPMLITSGLSDPRVTYWEPAKFVAKLRATMRGGGPIFLKTNMGAGHGGASGRFEALADSALVFAFALEVTGLAGAAP